MNLFRLLCHQKPERSPPHCPVCYRCFGVYLGFLLGEFSQFIAGVAHINKFISYSFLIPIAADGLTQYFTSYESSNKKRLVSGWLFGVGASLVSSNVIKDVYYSNLNFWKMILLSLLFSAIVIYLPKKVSSNLKRAIYCFIVISSLLIFFKNIFIIIVSI